MNHIDYTARQIRDRRSYIEAIQLLNKELGPPALLRVVMNALERYRQARKMGWSRPWNKYGVTTFRSYRLNAVRDGDLIDLAAKMTKRIVADAPPEIGAFVGGLLAPDTAARDRLMGFLFFQDITYEDRDVEAVTFSLGRVSDIKRHRDRLDLIFERDLTDGSMSLRVIVDPFDGVKPPLLDRRVALDETPGGHEILGHLCRIFNDWALLEDRHWRHWTQTYISYFGPRAAVPATSMFGASPGTAQTATAAR